MKEEKKKKTAEYNYTLQWLGNGVVVTDLNENLSACKEFSGKGSKDDFDDLVSILGKAICGDVWGLCGGCVCTDARIKIAIELP